MYPPQFPKTHVILNCLFFPTNENSKYLGHYHIKTSKYSQIRSWNQRMHFVLKTSLIKDKKRHLRWWNK